MCRSGHRAFVAPCTDLKSGTPNSRFYCLATPKVVIAAGGTGGHLFPALALALKLKSRNAWVEVIGKTSPVIAGEFTKAGVTFREVPVVRIPGKKTGFLLLPFRTLWAFIFSLFYLRRTRPDAVVGMGGYVSAAPAASAIFARIPLFFCEQNLLPGKVTRFFSRWSRAVFTSFPESARHLKSKMIIETGNPLRPFLEKKERKDARTSLGLETDRFTVLILGGSQGAHAINLKTISALEHLPPQKIQLIHLTGRADLPSVREAYEKRSFRNYTAAFLSRMELPYSAADLVVGRAGATTIAELAFFGLPSILIPYPYAAEKHQNLNAEEMVRNGAAVMREEAEIQGKELAELITELAGNPERFSAMTASAGKLSRACAADHIADYVLSSFSEKTSA